MLPTPPVPQEANPQLTALLQPILQPYLLGRKKEYRSEHYMALSLRGIRNHMLAKARKDETLTPAAREEIRRSLGGASSERLGKEAFRELVIKLARTILPADHTIMIRQEEPKGYFLCIEWP